jgi:hypothetical protein
MAKLPLKFILITLYTSFWVIISFAAAPYNIIIFAYWVFLVLIGGPVVYIFEE